MTESAQLNQFQTLKITRSNIVRSNITDIDCLSESIHEFERDHMESDSSMFIICEDISSNNAQMLGNLLDIDYNFFYNYLAHHEFHQFSPQPIDTTGAYLPSKGHSESHVHFRYKRILEMGAESPSMPYRLWLEGNSQRSVRRMHPVSIRCLGIAEACMSVIRKDLVNGNRICLILVDSDSAAIVSRSPEKNFRCSQTPYRHIYNESTRSSLCSPASQAHESHPISTVPRMVDEIVASISNAWSANEFRGNLSTLEVAAQAIEIILAEWALYSMLMGRYMMIYELPFDAIKKVTSVNIGNRMVDLHRWRRRSQRSLEKLQAIEFFIRSQPAQSRMKDMFIEDIQFLSNQIVQYRNGLESMIPVLTSMVQLLDSRRAIEETILVKRLTYLALVFLPLSYVASLFSMSDGFAINTNGFWIYIATAVPLLITVLMATFVPIGKLWPHWGFSQTSLNANSSAV